MGHNNYFRFSKKDLILLAREMRKYPTPAEKLLWEHLRAKRLGGFKFRRQHVIDRCIVDFCCQQARLVVEVDGPYHRHTSSYDYFRTQRLQDFGFRVKRFPNEEVLNRITKVAQQIQEYCLEQVTK